MLIYILITIPMNTSMEICFILMNIVMTTPTSIFMNMLIRISIQIRKSTLIAVIMGLMSTSTLTISGSHMSMSIRKGSESCA
jgi:hypothetical protein